MGKRLARLQKKQESSDYDDFFLVSQTEAVEQVESAEAILEAINMYLKEKQECRE